MIFGLFVSATRKANVFVVDTVRSNQMPNLVTMYNNERKKIINEEEAESVPEGLDFSV
jgi:DNA polymerase epsilon subunit 1